MRNTTIALPNRAFPPTSSAMYVAHVGKNRDDDSKGDGEEE